MPTFFFIVCFVADHMNSVQPSLIVSFPLGYTAFVDATNQSDYDFVDQLAINIEEPHKAPNYHGEELKLHLLNGIRPG